jgi:hypothetical protein
MDLRTNEVHSKEGLVRGEPQKTTVGWGRYALQRTKCQSLHSAQALMAGGLDDERRAAAAVDTYMELGFEA